MVLLLVGGVFGLVGVALTVGGVLMVRREKHFARVGVAVPGRVIEILREVSTDRDSDGRWRTSVTFHPVVAYRAVNGWEYRERSEIGRNPPGYAVGQPVQVRHLPDNPARFRIVGDRSGSFIGWVLSVLGALFTLLGFALLVGGLALGVG